MPERNRTFGRVSRPVDKASAPRQALERQRKSGRARNTATFYPKPQAARLREIPRDIASIPPALLVDAEALQSAIAAKPMPVEAPATENSVAIIEASALAELPPASLTEPREASLEAPAIVISADETAVLSAPPLAVAMDPAARPITPTPRRASRRRSGLQLAVVASVAVACLIAFARFSDAHLSAPAILSLAAPVASVDRTAPVVVALPQVAALTLAPADATTLPPPLATANGTGDLIERTTLPPSAGEHISARTAAIDAPIAATGPEKTEAQASRTVVRKPVAKPASRAAAPRARREASRREFSSRRPILDFLSSLIP